MREPRVLPPPPPAAIATRLPLPVRSCGMVEALSAVVAGVATVVVPYVWLRRRRDRRAELAVSAALNRYRGEQ